MYIRQWNRDGVVERKAPFLPYCFQRGKGKEGLKFAIDHGSVEKVEFDTTTDLSYYKYNHDTFESDIPFSRVIMKDMELEIKDVHKVYVDIEVDDTNGIPKWKRDPILSIAMVHDTGRKEWLFLDDYESEGAMLEDFIQRCKYVGAIGTWYGGSAVDDPRSFDIPYIANRYTLHGKPLDWSRLKHARFGDEITKERDEDTSNVTVADFDYRMRHVAYFDLYQIYKFERGRIGKSIRGGYGLDNIAKRELNDQKLRHTKRIHEMTREQLEEYNMHDADLVRRIDEKYHFLDMKIGLAQLTNLTMTSWNYHNNRKMDELRPLILTDQLVLKGARELGLVMNNRQFLDDFNVEGALVIQPTAGVYFNVQNIDVKQMYPSIMIFKQISPDKDRILIPHILKTLKKMRKQFKDEWEQKKKDQGIDDLGLYIKQYNYKVLANVFYGAFADASSRIASEDNANAITGEGRAILQKIIDYVGEQ